MALSVAHNEMAERLRQPTIGERLTLELVILRTVDECVRMRMLSELLGKASYYVTSVDSLVMLMKTVADERFLKDLHDAIESMKSAFENLSHQIARSKNRNLRVDLVRYADLKFEACMRLIQRRKMGFTLVEQEYWQ